MHSLKIRSQGSPLSPMFSANKYSESLDFDGFSRLVDGLQMVQQWNRIESAWPLNLRENDVEEFLEDAVVILVQEWHLS